jgi:hydrogenase maturation protease
VTRVAETPGGSIVIGLGATDCGDDAAGLEAARRLASICPKDARVVSVAGQPSALLDLWSEASLVVVIDAVISGAPPGTVRRLDGLAGPLPGGRRASTHDLGLADVVELGRALGRLPERLVILGIEAGDCSPGAALSPAVQEGVHGAVGLALAELAAARTPPQPPGQ